MILGMPIAISTSLLAPFLIELLYGYEYLDGVAALRILGLAIICTFISTYLVQVLIATEQLKIILAVTLLGLITSITW